MCQPKTLETIVTAAIATVSIAWFSAHFLPVPSLGNPWSTVNVLRVEGVPVSQI